MPSHGVLEADRYAQQYAREGYFICEGVLEDDRVERLRTAIAGIPDREEVRRRRGVYGVRNLLEICPAIQALAREPNIRQFVTPILGQRSFAVRAVFFDKMPGSNWSLFWHQDNVISVLQRVEVPGYLGWSNKSGVWQV